jgi:hypothetical protein
MATKAATVKENTAKATTKSGKNVMQLSIDCDVNIAQLEAKKVLLAELTAEIESSEDKLKNAAIDAWIEQFSKIKEYPESCNIQLVNESGSFLLTPVLTAKLSSKIAAEITEKYPNLVVTETKELETPIVNKSIFSKYEPKILEFLKTCEDVTPEDLANLVTTTETISKIDVELFKKPSFIHVNSGSKAYKDMLDITKVVKFQNKSFTPPSTMVVVATTNLQTINRKETNTILNETEVVAV